MLHDQQFGIRFASLRLGAHQRQEGFSDDDICFNSAFFEFDTVMETPRRARPSISQSEDRAFIVFDDLVDHLWRRWLGRAVFVEVVDIIRRPEISHKRPHAFQKRLGVRL